MKYKNIPIEKKAGKLDNRATVITNMLHRTTQLQNIYSEIIKKNRSHSKLHKNNIAAKHSDCTYYINHRSLYVYNSFTNYRIIRKKR